uniref:Uncharacterized protein n=1 Tax=Anopheles farauti TaxID=69004 RepID=A0A182QSS9_9DIPT
MEAVKPKARKKSSSKKSTVKHPASTSPPLETNQRAVSAPEEEEEETVSVTLDAIVAPPAGALSTHNQAVAEDEGQSLSNEEQFACDEHNPTQSKTDQDADIDFKSTAPTAPTAPPAPAASTPIALLYPDLNLLKIATAHANAQPMQNASETIISTSRTKTLYLSSIRQLEDTVLEADREQLDRAEREFVETENPATVGRDPGPDGDLVLALQTYRQVYHGYGELLKQRADICRQVSELRSRCWDFHEQSFTGTGYCADQKVVSASVKSRIATLHAALGKETRLALSSLLDPCITKEKEALIQLHHTRTRVEKKLFDPAPSDPVRTLRFRLRIIGNALRTESREACGEAERCEYLQNLRRWFVSVGLRSLQAGTVHERVWLMFHLLRFPNGAGTWAHVLLHPLPVTGSNVGDSFLGTDELQAVLTVTRVLLRPIAARQMFLTAPDEGVRPVEPDPATGTGTTFEWVDSDGEESAPDKRVRPIKESDLLALLDQIPFRRLFDTLTGRAMVPNGLPVPCTELLRLMTLTNRLISILGEGLVTYGGENRYHHFTQRLALLVNDAVKFVSDVFRCYRESRGPLPSEELELVQVHFDTLVYGAARCIYGGGIGLSRHLSTLPFTLLSTRACWWLYHCLLQRNFTLQPDFVPERMDLETAHLERLLEQELELDRAPHNLYNVLKPFVDLALARDDTQDREFIAAVAKALFQLLLSINANLPVCVELILEQLHLILEKNSFVLSSLLQTLVTDASSANAWQSSGTRLLEVFRNRTNLLLHWQPREQDIDVLLEMLLKYGRTHIYHKLALGLLMYINYGETGSIAAPELSRSIQQRIALCVVVAHRKNQPATKPDPSSTDHTELEHYRERCLFVLLQLRVHVLDRPMRPGAIDPATELRRVPSVEELADLRAAYDDRCPVGCLATLLTTTVGHWVPVFLHDGIPLLEVLVEQQLDTIVVRALELIALLFVECPQALSGSERFVALLTRLVQRDTELEWKAPQETPAVVVPACSGKMETMIVAQATRYWQGGYETPPLLVGMWCEWLMEIPAWINSAKVLRLLNVLASVSFGHPNAWNMMREKISPYFKSLSQAKQKQHSLWSKIIGNEPPLLYGHLLPTDCVPLALLIFEVEHRQLELATDLWPRLLRALKQTDSHRLDAALRDAYGTLRVREEDFCPAADSLVLYKIAHFLGRTGSGDRQHPLLLGLCQQFFTILLTRVTEIGRDEVHGVADRLCAADGGLLGKMKQLLCALEVQYHARQEADGDAGCMLSIVKAFQLWLVDPDLNRIAMDDPISLPTQYDVPHLQAALQGMQDCWRECANTPLLQSLHRTMAERWYNLYRVKQSAPREPNVSASKPAATLAPMDAIRRRLDSCYTDPLPPPLPEPRADLQELRHALQQPPMSRVKRITESLRVLKQHIDKTHWSVKAELDQRKHELYELYRQLYVNEDKQVVRQARCSVLYCAGAATIKVHTKQASVDRIADERIDARLRSLEAFLQLAVAIPPYVVQHAILLRELWNSLFVDYCSETEQATVQALNAANRAMLRTLLHEVSDANFVPPLTYAVRLSLDTYRSDLSKLMFEEVSQLFAGALAEGRKPSNVIGALLEDSRIPARPLLHVYGQLVRQASGGLERELFVEMFGNKLDLCEWLKGHDVLPDEVDQFAKLIVVGLYKTRPLDSVSPVRTDEQAELDERFAEMLTCHLVAFATHKFPEHYGKLLQHVLNAYSQWPTLPPPLLLRLLNVLRARAHLSELRFGMDEAGLRAAQREFAEANATTAPVIGCEVLEHLMVALTEHFLRQCDGAFAWSGIYKRHGAYVEVIGMLLGMVSSSYLSAGMAEHGIECVHDRLLPTIYRLYEPWIVPYGARGSTSPSESARHFNNDKAKWMFGTVLLGTVEHALDTVNRSCADSHHASRILLHLLNWYLEWFLDQRILISALYVFNTLLLDLPWEQLHPSELLIERMHSMLEHHSPDCHEFLACVFVRCRWTDEPTMPAPGWLQRTHAATLAICVRLAYEPVVRSEAKPRAAMVRILQHFTRLGWTSVHAAEIVPALDWFVMTADASIVLRTPKVPHRELDDALIELLEVVAGLRFNEANPLLTGSVHLAKRKLYIGVTGRMLMNAGRGASGKAAHVKPLLTAAIQRLLRSILAMMSSVAESDDESDGWNERSNEARAMLGELLVSVRKWQTEAALPLFVEELIVLLDSEENSRPVLTVFVLETVPSLLEKPTEPWLRLIEYAIGHFLRCNTSRPASWLEAIAIVSKAALDRWQYETLAQHALPLCLQLWFLHRWSEAGGDARSKVALVEQLLAVLPALKVAESNEAHLYPLWCTLLYTLSTLNPPPDGSVRTAIALLGTVSEHSSFWVVGMLRKILGKASERAGGERVSATRCLIAYACAALLARAYTSCITAAPADDDYAGTETGPDAFTLSKLLTTPDRRASPARIAAVAMENFRTACSGPAASGLPKEHPGRLLTIVTEAEGDRIFQPACDAVMLMDGRTASFLGTLLAALDASG